MDAERRKELRGFGIGLSLLFVVLAVLAWLGIGVFGRLGPRGSLVLGGLSVIALTTGLTRPAWLGPVHATFVFVTRPIAWFMTRLVLGVVYYVALWPTGLLRRMGDDPLTLSVERQPSYWVDRETQDDLTAYRRQS